MILAIVRSILLLVVAASAQNDDTIKVNTELAAVEVTVTDRDGRPVKGLTAADFRLLEQEKPVEISFFQPVIREDKSRPIVLVFALDLSGSMTVEEIAALRTALQKFVERLAARDTYFALMTFGMEVKVLQDFTNDAEKIGRSSRKLLGSDEGLSTHAYDAVDAAVRMLARKSPKSIRGKFPRRAVILVTDGFPVGDIVSPKTVIERANDAEVSVFSVIVPSFSRLQGKKKPLPTLLETSGLIEKTGGSSFYVNENNFEKLFDGLATELTSSYVLAFYPGSLSDGSLQRQIKVESRSGYRVKQNRTTYIRAAETTTP